MCGCYHCGDTDLLFVDIMIVEIQTRYCVDELCQELGEAVQVPPLNDLEELHCNLQTGVMEPQAVSLTLQPYYLQQKPASES